MDLTQLKLLTEQFYDKKIAEMDDFYLEYAKTALKEWKELRIDDTLLDDLLKSHYDNFLVDDREEVTKIRGALFRLVSYCDTNARDKNHYNKYDDNRVLAQAGIYQSQWVIQLLRYKKDPTAVAESISNVISYIEHPEINFPIVSEDHKEQISRNLLKNPSYDRFQFPKQLMDYFDQLGYSCSRKENKSILYSNMIYGIEKVWKDEYLIKGLVARDTSDWKADFESGVSQQGWGIMWRHTRPRNSVRTIKALKKIIEKGETFKFYIVEKNWTTYVAVVEDFVLKEDYPAVRDKWKAKNPYWYEDNFEDYFDGKRHAEIAFLVSSFKYIPSNQQLNIDDNFELLEKPVRDKYSAFYNIIKQTTFKMKNTTSEIVSILLKKKNIILQGAPGTGKTFYTSLIALSLINETHIDWNDSKSVREEYQRLINEGRIAFTTFHQSMDYEDFVEGYKPVKTEKELQFELRPGIFRRICEDAKSKPCVLIIDEINRGNISKIFGELITLIEADKREGSNCCTPVNLTYSGVPFLVPENLYIIGTMNTTDRSVGSIDYALRRRFAFYSLLSDVDVIKGQNIDESLKSIEIQLYESVEQFLKNNHPDMKMDDLKPGHSYFMAKDNEELSIKLNYELIPLIEEYVKDGIIEVSDDAFQKAIDEWKQLIK